MPEATTTLKIDLGHAHRALYVNSGACNLSGVAHSLGTVVSELWKDPQCQGTDWVNRHPVVVIMVAQMWFLASGQQDHVNCKAFDEALDAVTAAVREANEG